MNHNDEAIKHAPGLDLQREKQREAWLAWVDYWYPYNRKTERELLSRLPDTKPPVQSPEELEDLGGLRDREMAWFLARAWFVIRDREARKRRAATKMPTREQEQQRLDLYGALDQADENIDQAEGF